jgi:intein/homing endonuclease
MTLIPKKSISKYNVNHNIFQEESERSFYLAGFIAADGCIRITGNKKNKYINHRLQISLSKNDEEHLILIRDLLESNHPIANYLIENSKRNSKWNDVWESKLMITSKQIVEDLQKFNIVPKKSLIYSFPEWLIDHPLVNHFMRGYFDGDGSFFVNSELSYDRLCCSIRGTESFLQVYKNILQDKCNFECKDNIDRSNQTPQLRFKGKFALKVRDYLYSNSTMHLERKFIIAYNIKENNEHF